MMGQQHEAVLAAIRACMQNGVDRESAYYRWAIEEALQRIMGSPERPPLQTLEWMDIQFSEYQTYTDKSQEIFSDARRAIEDIMAWLV